MVLGNVEIRHLERRVTIKCTLTSEFKARLYIAKCLLLLAARVINANIEIEETPGS